MITKKRYRSSYSRQQNRTLKLKITIQGRDNPAGAVMNTSGSRIFDYGTDSGIAETRYSPLHSRKQAQERNGSHASNSRIRSG